jgi:hypothetical protein
LTNPECPAIINIVEDIARVQSENAPPIMLQYCGKGYSKAGALKKSTG